MEHRSIYVEHITTQGEVYLTRVHLTPWQWWPFKTRIYLHVFSRPDEDRVFHDHPWDFRTIVLFGGYDEESHQLNPHRETRGDDDVMRPTPTGKVIPDTLGFLSMRWRPATHAHRITRLHTRKVVTLILRGDRRRNWGFWCPPNLPEFDGITRSTVNNKTEDWLWVYWRNYLDQRDPAVGEQY